MTLKFNLRSRGLFISFLAFGMLTQVISILMKPKANISDASSDFCNFYISKFNTFFIHINCDSQYFLLDSQDPSRIINNQSPLQDRFLHTFLVFIFSRIFGLIGVPEGPVVYLGEDNIPQTYNILNYALYISINVLTLLLSFWLISIALGLFKRKLDRVQTILIFSTIVFTAQNPITREFFWTPHSQIFNILIVCLLFFFAQEEFVVTKRNYFLVFTFLSVCLLIYPAFLILLPILLVRVYRAIGAWHSVLLLFCLIPRTLYPVILEFFGGEYVEWTVKKHRRGIWLIDSAQAGTLLTDLRENLNYLAQSLPFAWLLILCLLFLIYIKDSYKIGRLDSGKKQQVQDASLVCLLYLLGLFINGAYSERFSIGLVILLILFVTKFTLQRPKPPVSTLVVFIFVVCLNMLLWLANW